MIVEEQGIDFRTGSIPSAPFLRSTYLRQITINTYFFVYITHVTRGKSNVKCAFLRHDTTRTTTRNFPKKVINKGPLRVPRFFNELNCIQNHSFLPL